MIAAPLDQLAGRVLVLPDSDHARIREHINEAMETRDVDPGQLLVAATLTADEFADIVTGGGFLPDEQTLPIGARAILAETVSAGRSGHIVQYLVVVLPDPVAVEERDRELFALAVLLDRDLPELAPTGSLLTAAERRHRDGKLFGMQLPVRRLLQSFRDDRPIPSGAQLRVYAHVVRVSREAA